MRMLVTGAAGFAGGHLTALLRADGHQVTGLVRHAAEESDQTIVVDLTDPVATRDAVCSADPEVVFHLAAASSPAECARDPEMAVRDNVTATASLLAALRETRPRLLLVTSSEVYGRPADDRPLTESSPPRPLSAYGRTKLAVHDLGQRALAEGLPVIEARPFNHAGPGQRLGFVVPDFASQLAAIAAGRAEPVVTVGDLRPRRDFSDVRDIVRGYRELALRGEPGGVYHLCSGRAVSIQAILDELIGLAGVTVEVRSLPDPDHRSAPVIVGSYARALTAVGWSPEVPLRQTLADVLAEWRARA